MKSTLKWAIFTLTVVIVSGCASTTPLNDDEIANLEGRQLTTSSREFSDFAAITLGKAYLGVAGSVGMFAAGNQIVQENNIDDPTPYVARQLAGALADTHQVAIAKNNGTIATGVKVAELAELYQSSDYLLDIHTLQWGFLYYLSNFKKYHVIYDAKLRLIDTETKKVVAQGTCRQDKKDVSQAATKDQLLANNAARLKREIMAAADQCIAKFKTDVLHL